ncbi:PE domain-containing protein OS=Tsukamurella paurometabola (strain ATCC 8368 / DSM / CCUG 35730/ CIP 100753 / JCM 10117 / KCTC 9821 / NBRC 16120 / NCIMB 702349 / NCTC 13040) OX=521096 GN=Tpau_2921 PE=4 SV=1 [Tsukamurella paurometabola]|uniref:Uncharacterized protein n=1 Tax=Tsukamurella paurometabola (strain ATCC 8368 / DSM 20162 / CCUG 35730 / CIP 100753 / JCM 10117 / KCTC 9821 / NBRC 16120 / NCIMB 702349 / NCTC 13040) TaxID=521096 RepID=D5UU16_TSUPD|nr:hypothetical protein [Tsukamurella paurometabola]ADG79519.1 hypothetical protein Tpau_2921 [Tsukamurella paurometabola DSM 20162]SUP36065.1 Uncharacterised protein [Tsukamurella paurometabola]
MSDGTLGQIMDEAQAAIADRPNMVMDGNPHEELARALERHAERITEAAKGLREVGRINYLGPTVEGEAATYNIRLGAVEHEQSLRSTYLAQATEARALAESIRATGRRILRTEGVSADEIDRLIRQ